MSEKRMREGGAGGKEVVFMRREGRGYRRGGGRRGVEEEGEGAILGKYNPDENLLSTGTSFFLFLWAFMCCFPPSRLRSF